MTTPDGPLVENKDRLQGVVAAADRCGAGSARLPAATLPQAEGLTRRRCAATQAKCE